MASHLVIAHSSVCFDMLTAVLIWESLGTMGRVNARQNSSKQSNGPLQARSSLECLTNRGPNLPQQMSALTWLSNLPITLGLRLRLAATVAKSAPDLAAQWMATSLPTHDRAPANAIGTANSQTRPRIRPSTFAREGSMWTSWDSRHKPKPRLSPVAAKWIAENTVSEAVETRAPSAAPRKMLPADKAVWCRSTRCYCILHDIQWLQDRRHPNTSSQPRKTLKFCRQRNAGCQGNICCVPGTNVLNERQCIRCCRILPVQNVTAVPATMEAIDTPSSRSSDKFLVCCSAVQLLSKLAACSTSKTLSQVDVQAKSPVFRSGKPGNLMKIS